MGAIVGYTLGPTAWPVAHRYAGGRMRIVDAVDRDAAAANERA